VTLKDPISVFGGGQGVHVEDVSAKDLDCSSVLLQKPVIQRAMLFVRSVLSGTDLLSAITMA